jgi:hypothetical protein
MSAKTIPAWKKYQHDAAAVFRRIGLKAEVEQLIVGACATHKADVYVTGKFGGLDIKWVIECKAWRSNVPKEKVAALIAIVQDVGADKGVLLSEKGFQSGSISMARKKNIVLTSIADLSEQVSADFAEAIISKLEWRLNRVKERLWRLHKAVGEYYRTPHLIEQGKLFVLDLAFSDAHRGEFPTIYAVDQKTDHRLKASSLDELVAKADVLISDAERHCDNAEAGASRGASST